MPLNNTLHHALEKAGNWALHTYNTQDAFGNMHPVKQWQDIPKFDFTADIHMGVADAGLAATDALNALSKQRYTLPKAPEAMIPDLKKRAADDGVLAEEIRNVALLSDYIEAHKGKFSALAHMHTALNEACQPLATAIGATHSRGASIV